MIKTRANFSAQRRVGHHLRPEQQEVIVVQHVLRLLGFHVGAKQLLELALPLRTPGENLLQHVGQRPLAVDDARIDRQAGSLLRKALLAGGQAKLVADQAEQVFGVAPVVNGEGLVQTDARRVVAQQARRHAVKSAGPGQRRQASASAPSQDAD